jgi:hypothetical protein
MVGSCTINSGGGSPTLRIVYTRIDTSHIVLDLLLPSHSNGEQSHAEYPLQTPGGPAAAAKILFEQSQMTVSELGMQQSATQGTWQQQLSNIEWRSNEAHSG